MRARQSAFVRPLAPARAAASSSSAKSRTPLRPDRDTGTAHTRAPARVSPSLSSAVGVITRARARAVGGRRTESASGRPVPAACGFAGTPLRARPPPARRAPRLTEFWSRRRAVWHARFDPEREQPGARHGPRFRRPAKRAAAVALNVGVSLDVLPGTCFELLSASPCTRCQLIRNPELNGLSNPSAGGWSRREPEPITVHQSQRECAT